MTLILAEILNLVERRPTFISSIVTICYACAYAILRYLRLFHPQVGVLKSSEEAEWRSRILGIFNGTIITFGSVLCYLSWPEKVEEDSWIAIDGDLKNAYPALFISLLIGFFQWDFVWLLAHMKENYDPSAIFHHIIYIFVTQYCIFDRCLIRTVAWLTFAELSTPFLHLRWYLAAINEKNNFWYVPTCLAFASTFLFTRIFCYSLGIADLWYYRTMWSNENTPFALYAVVAALHAGCGLNYFWSLKVIQALLRLFNIAGSEESKKS